MQQTNDSKLAKVLHYYGYDVQSDKIICPFHEDVNPSMKIDYLSDRFYCFGCNISGNALDFVQKMENKNDALQACIHFEKIIRSRKVKQLRHKLVIRYVDNHQALIEASDYYNGLSKTNWYKENSEIKLYMKKRGFSSKTLNMCKAKLNYNSSYPIIFPMMDNGEFRGWVCRTNDPIVEKKRKYLYNQGFSRATTLVGNYSNSKVVVLVEGYMDMLKMNQFGLKKVAAILGWKITANQIDKLRKAGVTTIISALDNDDCGKKGTEYLKQYFNVIRFQYPANVKDAGEMNKVTFDAALEKTKDEFRRNKNGSIRRHQNSSKKVRNK